MIPYQLIIDAPTNFCNCSKSILILLLKKVSCTVAVKNLWSTKHKTKGMENISLGNYSAEKKKPGHFILGILYARC